MSFGSAIKAGQAYVELLLEDDKLVRGLRSAQRKVAAFGKSVAKVGGMLTGAGSALSAPFVLAAKNFADAGDELNKMAARTGATVEALSELKFAAEQSGAGIDVVEKGIKGMARTLYDAERGLSTAQDALADIGVTLDDLKGQSPEDQFTMLADRLSAIGDPTRRAGVAMKLFGRAGTDLLPLFNGGAAGMSALRAVAQRLAITMSTEDAAAAADFTDAMHELWSQVKMVTFQIGKAVGDALVPWLRSSQESIATVINWVKEHQGMVTTALAVAGAVTAAGAALTAIGATIAATSTAIGGLATAVALVTKVMAAAKAGTLAFRFGLAGLAVAGIAAVAIAVYKANPHIREFNRQLAIGRDLSGQMATKQQKRQQNFLADVAVMHSPAAKKQALAGKLGEEKKNLSGLEAQVKSAEKAVARLDTAFNRSTGNKLLAGAQEHLDETRQRLEAGKAWIEELQDAIKSADREAAAGGPADMQAQLAAAAAHTQAMTTTVAPAAAAQAASAIAADDIPRQQLAWLKQIADNTQPRAGRGGWELQP